LAKIPPGDIFLTSPRFTLRRIKPDDAHPELIGWTLDAMAAEMLNAPQIAWPVEAQRAFFASFEKLPSKLLLGIFAKDDQRFIGFYILKLNPGNSTFTMSTLIGDAGWRGKGASGEASNAVCDYFFNTLGYVKAKANVRPQNKAMLWLMLTGVWKKEARLVKHLAVPGTDDRADVFVFGLLADDWRAQQKAAVVPKSTSD
jgi:RimJ/RimL family protein N-acetyltransferase